MKSLAFAILCPFVMVVSPWAGAQTAVPAKPTFVISGQVGIPGVVLGGLPGNPVSDENGAYEAEVPFGFTATVRPFREGFKFKPPSRKYSDMREDRRNDNFTAAAMAAVTISGNAGAPYVRMRGLPGDPVTDMRGNYSAKVPYDWSSAVTPEKEGYVFYPPCRDFDSIESDLMQNFMARVARIPGLAMGHGVVVVPTASVNAAQFAETAEDMQVMLQILREKTNEQRTSVGRTVLPDYGPLFGASGRRTEAFYIQGYAAMFVMEVDFPLVSPPEPGAAGGQRQGGDPVWQRAREKLTESGQSGSSGETSPFNLNQFKENLVLALRHAANIRHLDPNERVILTVIGTNRPTSLPGGGIAYGPYGAGGGGFSMQGGGYTYGGTSSSTDSPSGYSDTGGFSSFLGAGRWPHHHRQGSKFNSHLGKQRADHPGEKG